MQRTLIQPTFTPDNIAGNALELCDLFWLPSEDKVPIARFRITSDEVVTDTEVGPGTYKSALLLLYQMTKVGNAIFQLTPEMQRIAFDYYGPTLVADAIKPETAHRTLRALLGQSVRVSLVLNPGYREHMVSAREPEEIIRHAWERRNDIKQQSPEPFLRRALLSFFQQIESGTLRVDETNGHWPTPVWADQALILERLLHC